MDDTAPARTADLADDQLFELDVLLDRTLDAQD
jgi:hypothetical protein